MYLNAKFWRERREGLERLERESEQFEKKAVNFLLGDFNARIGQEGIFKTTIGNKYLHKFSNENVPTQQHS